MVLALLLPVYVFVVGHFNFPIALATAAIIFVAYRNHDGDLDRWF
jgi:hypothetical protein